MSDQILTFISRQFHCESGSLLPADYRYIGKINDQIVAHAALTARGIEINDRNYNSLLLGKVCIKSELKRTGLGSRLLNYIKSYSFTDNYDLILLNCGEQIVTFYNKNGFFRISPAASYVRGQRVEVDEDPVLCFIMNDSIKSDDLQCDTVFLGKDF